MNTLVLVLFLLVFCVDAIFDVSDGKSTCTPTVPVSDAMSQFRMYVKGIWKEAKIPGAIIKPVPFFEKGYLQYPDRSHWEKVVSKLKCGQPIRVVIIGGSITNGGGLKGENRGTFRWGNIFLQYLNMSFPHPDHEFRTFGVQGSGSGYFSMCVSSYVPRDPDIVLTEFAVNDREVGTVVKHNYAALVKQLVGVGAKLIVSVNWCVKFDLHLKRGVTSRSRKNVDVYSSVLQPLGMVALDAFPFMKANSKLNAFDGAWHPNEMGHAFIAQMVANWFDFGFTHDFQSGDQPSKLLSLDTDLASQRYTEEEMQNVESSMCFFDDKLKPTLNETQGFTWKDEGKPGRPKVGYVGTEPGDTLVLGPFDVSAVHGASVGYLASYDGYGQFRITTDGCKAYGIRMKGIDLRGMPPRFPFPVVDCHRGEHTSVTQITIFTVVPESPQCTFRFTIVNSTRSSGHKVKINSLTLLRQNISFAGHTVCTFKDNKKKECAH